MGGIFSKNNEIQDDNVKIDYGLSEAALKELEEQLKKVKEQPIFKTLMSKEKVTQLITEKHIKTPFLKEIFKGNSEEALIMLNQNRLSKKFELQYEHDIILAFWLAIQKEDIRVASNLVDFDTSLRYITTIAIKGKKECKYTENKVNYKDSKKVTSNDASIDITPRSDNKSATPSNNLISPDDKSGTSVIDKSQLEGGQNNQQPIKKQRVNNVQLEVEDLFEGGSDGQGSSSEGEQSGSCQSHSHSASNSGTHSSFDDGWNDSPQPVEDKGEDDSDDSSVKENSINNLNDSSPQQKSGKDMPPSFQLYNHNIEDYLEYKLKLTGWDIETTEIRTKWQIQKIKVGFQLNFPKLMAQIINILLYREEEHLACYLTAFYDFTLDYSMVIKAIEKDNYMWLNYVWAFNKNFFEVEAKEKDEKGKARIIKKIVDLEELFRIIIAVWPDINKQQEEVKKCCLWYLDFEEEQSKDEPKSSENENQNENEEEGKDDKDQEKEKKDKDDEKDTEDEPFKENILKALLFHMLDGLCLEFMGYYSDLLDEELFLFSLDKNNTVFIQQSLIMGAFDNQKLRNEIVVEKMIEYLNVGSKTNFLLNTMILVDVSLWKFQQIIDLIEMLAQYAGDSYDENRLLLSYNPMQAIALSAEILDMIAQRRKRFENQCNNLKEELLELGRVYNSKIDDEAYFKELIMDTDFENRTVLKIITQKKFAALMHEDDPKAENIMGQIYIGEEATRCDGNIYGYSTYVHILTQKPKKIADASDNDFLSMITIDFKYKIDVDYTFQHRYRSRSIKMYFIKEMIFGFITLCISITIYMQYLSSFIGPRQYIITKRFDNGTISSKLNSTLITNEMYDYAQFVKNIDQRHQYLSTEDYHRAVEENYDKFIGTWSYVQYGMTSILLLSLALRIYFNLFKKKGVNNLTIDKWLTMDIVYALYSFVIFWYIQMNDATMLYGPHKKKIDMFVGIVFTIALARFFMLQLVVASVSKMLITLVNMLIDVLPFGAIMVCYMYVATQVFSTRYQDINQDAYGTIQLSLMTCFNAMMGGYDYIGVNEDEAVYTLIIIFHIFVINILMLNYMIAILSSTYGDMLESGSFLYKCALYEYCERYMIAFDEKRLGELVIHSPPVNLMCLVMLPFTIIPDTINKDKEITYSFMSKVAKGFSIFNFWLENIIGIAFFIVFELILMPFVYLLTFFNIIYSTHGLFTTAFNVIKWACLGFLYLIHILFYDTGMLMWIMAQHKGCREVLPDPKDKEGDDEESEIAAPTSVVELDIMDDQNKQIRVLNEIRITAIKMYQEIHKQIKGEIDDAEEPTDEEKQRILDDLTNDILKRLNADEEDEEVEFDVKEFNVKLVGIQDEWKKSKVKSPEEQKDELSLSEEANKEEDPLNLSQEEAKSLNKTEKEKDKSGFGAQQTAKQKLQQQLIGAQSKGVTEDHQRAARIKDALIEKQPEDDQQGNDNQQEEEEKKVDEKEYPQDECDFVGDILEKFLIGSDSAFLDTVNLVLMLRALPNKIVAANLPMSMKFNFSTLQNSLIAFQTADQVQAFEHFDIINRKRIQNIKDCIMQQNRDLQQVNTIMTTINSYVQSYESIIKDFKELWAGYEKKRIEKDRELKRKAQELNQPTTDKKGKKTAAKKKGKK